MGSKILSPQRLLDPTLCFGPHKHRITKTHARPLVRAHGHAISAACCCVCQGSAPIIHIDSWRREETAPRRETLRAVVPISWCLCLSECLSDSFFVSKSVQSECINRDLGGGLRIWVFWSAVTKTGCVLKVASRSLITSNQLFICTLCNFCHQRSLYQNNKNKRRCLMSWCSVGSCKT